MFCIPQQCHVHTKSSLTSMTENITDCARVRRFFSSNIWKGLRPKEKTPEPKTPASDGGDSENGKSYISRPTNFQINKLVRENYQLNYSSVEDCPFLVTGYGTLLKKDRLKLKKPARKKLTVFLFETIILLTTVSNSY